MNCLKAYTAIVLLFFSLSSLSQDIKKRKTISGNYIEEFFTLGGNKNVKHGEYVKFYKDVLNRKIPVEYGKYENGSKKDVWYTFYPNGFLRSFGSYNDGLRHGLWKEFYNPEATMENVLANLMNPVSQFKTDAEGNLFIETKEQTVAATGVFEDGRKSGAWNYYSMDGRLIHKFNHSTKQFIVFDNPDPKDPYCLYLGGIERFFNEFFSESIVFRSRLPLEDYKTTLRVNLKEAPVIVERLYPVGVNKKADYIESIVKSISDDWFNTSETDFIIITVDVIKKSGELTYKFDFSK